LLKNCVIVYTSKAAAKDTHNLVCLPSPYNSDLVYH
jgi:hypothetical protein